MKNLAVLTLVFLTSCFRGESFYAKDCVYHSWADGRTHCSRYNLVKVDRETQLKNDYQYYSKYANNRFYYSYNYPYNPPYYYVR